MFDETIKQKAACIFIRKKCNIKTDEVIAALITIISKLSNQASILNENHILEELIDIYDIKQNENALELIGMSPKSVYGIIEYPIDFNDSAKLSIEYFTNKDEYDFLYRLIEARFEDRIKLVNQQSKTIKMT